MPWRHRSMVDILWKLYFQKWLVYSFCAAGLVSSCSLTKCLVQCKVENSKLPISHPSQKKERNQQAIWLQQAEALATVAEGPGPRFVGSRASEGPGLHQGQVREGNKAGHCQCQGWAAENLARHHLTAFQEELRGSRTIQAFKFQEALAKQIQF